MIKHFFRLISSLKQPTHDTICRTTDRSTVFEATVGMIYRLIHVARSLETF
jgi:hypothetical protein